MKTRKKWTENEDKTLEEMYVNGASASEIANVIGCTKYMIYARKNVLLKRKSDEIKKESEGR